MKYKICLGSLVCATLLSGCYSTTTTSTAVEPPTVNTYNTQFKGEKRNLAVGKFVNRSNFQNGLFSNGQDLLGNQAKTALMSHLHQSTRFNVLDRDNLSMLSEEAKRNGEQPALASAKYVLTGDVTEFGRKAISDTELFGLLGRGKTQVAYAKVTLNVVDAKTSEVVYSVQGAGEYALSDREVFGFGTQASYDATLNGKVIDLAIREVVNKLVTGSDSGRWGS